MYVIAGLGNPGSRYQGTRHNAGFEVIEKLAEEYGIRVGESKHRALLGKGIIQGEKVLLVKPMTYMNDSGESLREITDYYKIDVGTQLLVISDDICLPCGSIRMRKKGSAGGHNGLKSIIAHLGTENFPRIRVGVGEKPAGADQINFVLGRYSKEDRMEVDKAEETAAKAIEAVLSRGMDEAMNLYNRKPMKEKDGGENGNLKGTP